MQPTSTGRFRVHDRRPRPDVGGRNTDHGGDDDERSVDDEERSVDDEERSVDDEERSVDDEERSVDDEERSDDDEGRSDDDEGRSDDDEGRSDDRTDTPASDEFVLVELPEEPVDPTDPSAADVYDPLYASAEGYSGDLGDRIAALDPGTVVDATLAWDDGTARFSAVAVVREDRFRFADGIEGMFEAAVEEWRRIRAEGESIGAVTTRSNDGEPNGALYLFADGPGNDVYADLRAARVPIEPLIARVNARRGDGTPREVFVLRPIAHDFVAVHVVFDREGVLARTVRDTYDLGEGVAAGLDPSRGSTGAAEGSGDRNTGEDGEDGEDNKNGGNGGNGGNSEEGGLDLPDRV